MYGWRRERPPRGQMGHLIQIFNEQIGRGLFHRLMAERSVIPLIKSHGFFLNSLVLWTVKKPLWQYGLHEKQFPTGACCADRLLSYLSPLYIKWYFVFPSVCSYIALSSQNGTGKATQARRNHLRHVYVMYSTGTRGTGIEHYSVELLSNKNTAKVYLACTFCLFYNHVVSNA